MWLLHQVDEDMSAYNVPLAVRIAGAVDVDLLRLALTDVLGRHEVLRTLIEQYDAAGLELPALLALLEAHPEVMSLNAHIEQKTT